MPLTVAGTDYILMPVGTTAQRPDTPVAGMTRYNSTTGLLEYYNGTTWLAAGAYSAEYLIVAGGGGGARVSNDRGGGGGGAGGLLSSTFNFLPTNAYTITVGAGGAGASVAGPGSIGGLSAIADIRVIGGGGGGARDGGSGGGASQSSVNISGGNPIFSTQGFAGGSTTGSVEFGYSGGGGGGAGGVGTNGGTSTTSRAGGVGVSSSITGSAVTYATGGNGSGIALTNGATGSANTGNGGGGGANGGVGGSGGSGIVVIRYLGAQRGTGGTVTSSGGYTIHTFTSSGTFTA